MVEQSNNHDGRVDYFNNSKISDGWTVEHLMVEQWNRDGGTAGGGKVEQWNFCWWNRKQRWLKSETSDGGTVEHLMVEQWNI